MSKLADRIRRALRAEAAQMGFGLAAERRASPTLLCLLRVDGDQAKKIGGDAGADAVILTGTEAAKLGDALKPLGDLPVGLLLAEAQRRTVAAAREAGADFVLLDEESAAEAVLEEKVGFVLRVAPDASDTELRALAGLPLDALEIAAIEEPFNIRRLVELRRVALLSQTPLLVEVAADTAAGRLEALREAGVAGVILDGKSADKLAALREAVLALPARGRRRDERAEALLPTLTAVPDVDEEGPEFE